MSLAEAGYEVTIIGPGAPELAGERGGVRIETIPRARSLSQRLLNIVRLLKRSLRANADIYHFHDAELLLLGVVLWLRGKKVIYDVHEHFPQVAHVRPWVPDGLRRPLSVLVDAGEQWLSRCLSAVVGVVEEQGSRFERRPFAAVKNYPRMELFAAMADRLPAWAANSSTWARSLPNAEASFCSRSCGSWGRPIPPYGC